MVVQQGRKDESGEAYIVRYVESLTEPRTQLRPGSASCYWWRNQRVTRTSSPTFAATYESGVT